MFFTAVVAVCVATHTVASASILQLPDKIYYDLENAENLFKDHVKAFQKKYDIENYHKRLEIFKANLKMINERNAKYPETVFGVTRFADFTKEEIRSFYGSKPLNDPIGKDEININIPPIVKSEHLPVSFNWRDQGAVSHVKNQHMCSSHVFSAIGNIEGQYAIKHKQCIAFSEQQCLDCLPGINCNEGRPDAVMNALSKRSGCMKETDYPYLGVDGQQCEEKADKVIAKVIGGTKLNVTDAKDLKQKLYHLGPLSILLDPMDFAHYLAGLLRPIFCSSDPKYGVHAVLLVGYGNLYGSEYWILKDSSGAGALHPGYVYIYSGINACGVEHDGVFTSQVA